MNSNDPLHGLTLESILTDLVDQYGWDGLAERVNIRCFTHDPSIKSSLKFLRKTPWARTKVEECYLRSQGIRPARPKYDQAKTSSRPAKPAASHSGKSSSIDPWAKHR